MGVRVGRIHPVQTLESGFNRSLACIIDIPTMLSDSGMTPGYVKVTEVFWERPPKMFYTATLACGFSCR